MNVDLYERIWMWLATALIVIFVATIAVTTGVEAIQPPATSRPSIRRRSMPTPSSAART